MKTIRSNNHQLGSYGLNKVSLSCFDDKRYILDDVHIHMLMVITKYKTKIRKTMSRLSCGEITSATNTVYFMSLS